MALHGIIPAVLTPFDRHGQVEAAQLHEYVDWLISKGVHGLFPCGTNGEGPAMSGAQRRLVTEVTLRAAAGRVPVVSMTGAIATQETIELTLHAREAGASGAAIVAPWYFPHDDLALERHFSAVAEAVPDLDLYLYNIPGNAKNEISPALAGRLAEQYPHIRGIKDSSKNLDQLKRYIAALPGHTVIVGTDAMLVAALEAGAHGLVSAVADCFPEVMVAIWADWHAGERTRAAERQVQANRLRDALKRGPYIHPYKLAVAWRGVGMGGMCPPLRECSPDEASSIRAALEELGVL